MLPFPTERDIDNESDVEQKLILPLLLNEKPYGFGFSSSEIRTKPSLKVLIDKGTSSKLYFPDYVIIQSGLPVVVIEVKTPGEDLEEAFRQAQLYAHSLNSKFPTRINPCQKVIASDGLILLAGNFDSASPIVKLSLTDFEITNVLFDKLINFSSKEVVSASTNEILKTIRGGSKYIKPIQLLGGKIVQNVEMKENSFGATLSQDFRGVFNPESINERKSIIDNAYVTTKRLINYITPIEKIIRNTRPIELKNVRNIENTEDPRELYEKFSNKENLKNQLLLLIGNVGAGKSTFTDFLKEKGLPEDVKKTTQWVSININQAPLNKEEIYRWIKEHIIESLTVAYSDIDFEEKDVLLKLYGSEFKALRKGVAKFYEPGSEKYNELFAQKLIELESDLDAKVKAYVRFCCINRGKLLVVVLDNCDKRNADDQLLMFDVATWLKEYFNCLVFLPLRDTTFSIYRKQKPLDTVIKDLVFSIDPPLLRHVILERVKYTLRILGVGKRTLSYELSNGIKVEYPQSEQGYYLASIVRSLFENTYFNRLISGISGRDIRRGLEVFLDFCKSGHIEEEEILKMKKFGAQHVLRNHYVSRILLRGNNKYYSDINSVIKNLFVSYPEEDVLPNPFTRYFILRWLHYRYHEEGPNRMKGYHKTMDLVRDLIIAGHEKHRIVHEINFLIQVGCIISESQSDHLESESELIRISSYGMIHIDLVENDLNYLAACSEDTYYRDLGVATEIYNNISGKTGYGHYSKMASITNANLLVSYLKKYYESHVITTVTEDIDKELKNIDSLYLLDRQQELIEKFLKDSDYSRSIKPLVDYPVGTVVDCQIVSIQNYGAFVEFGLDASGLIHVSLFEKNGESLDEYEVGDKISAEIITYSEPHKRFNLKFLNNL